MGNNVKRGHKTPHLVFAEMLFVYLPLIVLIISACLKALTQTEQNENDLTIWQNLLGIAQHVCSKTEIAFAAAVLFGLAATKCVMFAGKALDRKWEHAAGYAAYIIVLGLVPTLLILGHSLTHEGQPVLWLTVLQTVLLIIASIVFLTTSILAERIDYPNQQIDLGNQQDELISFRN